MSIAHEIDVYTCAPVDGFLPIAVSTANGSNTASVTFGLCNGTPMAEDSDGTFYSCGFQLTLATTWAQDITGELTLPDGYSPSGGRLNGQPLTWSSDNGTWNTTLPGAALNTVLNDGGATIDFSLVHQKSGRRFDPGIRVTPA